AAHQPVFPVPEFPVLHGDLSDGPPGGPGIHRHQQPGRHPELAGVNRRVKPAFPSTQTFLPPGAELLRHTYSPTPGQTVLVFGIVQPFALHAPGQTSGPAPGPLWDHVAAALGKTGLLDEGWPKARGELLAA